VQEVTSQKGMALVERASMGTSLTMVIHFIVVPITIGPQHMSRAVRELLFCSVIFFWLCACREFYDEAHWAWHPEHGKCRPDHQWCDCMPTRSLL